MSYVRDVLTRRISVDLDPNQRHVLDLLLQQWYDVERHPELTKGFCELLHDSDPKLRAAAVQFFVSRMAADGGSLLDAYENRLREFEGVPRYWYPGEGDLRDLLVLAISKRMLPGSRALELMRGEVLRPGHGGYAVVGILATDPAWLRQNLVEVVSGSPDALPAILLNLGVLDIKPDRLVAQLKGHVPDQLLLEAICTAVPSDRDRLAALVVGDAVSVDVRVSRKGSEPKEADDDTG